MFRKLNVPVLGIIENMSYLQNGDEIIDIFGRGGGKAIAEKAKKEKLGPLVLDRNGYPYHGRVKVFAEAARENGLEF